ncbi:hypothetical protein BJ508DRAFT_338037 [Ascobolus immersus RN42]|uniref:Uncharacterized protein n=1 Tax=Ascobolus immersus RN42 TaxID=1160509 RepID=A0A3N4HQQ9_ASCIM|nr:hypothetical protein BJ508DRAFT_338037 [Ascobolus immersus RN42]
MPCRNIEHKHAPHNNAPWPTSPLDPTKQYELDVLACENVCDFCNNPFPDAPRLRQHLRLTCLKKNFTEEEYSRITIKAAQRGRKANEPIDVMNHSPYISMPLTERPEQGADNTARNATKHTSPTTTVRGRSRSRSIRQEATPVSGTQTTISRRRSSRSLSPPRPPTIGSNDPAPIAAMKQLVEDSIQKYIAQAVEDRVAEALSRRDKEESRNQQCKKARATLLGELGKAEEELDEEALAGVFRECIQIIEKGLAEGKCLLRYQSVTITREVKVCLTAFGFRQVIYLLPREATRSYRVYKTPKILNLAIFRYTIHPPNTTMPCLNTKHKQAAHNTIPWPTSPLEPNLIYEFDIHTCETHCGYCSWTGQGYNLRCHIPVCIRDHFTEEEVSRISVKRPGRSNAHKTRALDAPPCFTSPFKKPATPAQKKRFTTPDDDDEGGRADHDFAFTVKRQRTGRNEPETSPLTSLVDETESQTSLRIGPSSVTAFDCRQPPVHSLQSVMKVINDSMDGYIQQAIEDGVAKELARRDEDRLDRSGSRELRAQLYERLGMAEECLEDGVLAGVFQACIDCIAKSTSDD